MNLTMKKTLLASSIAITLGTANAEAALVSNLFGNYTWNTNAANFTMLAANGGVVGGTNDVAMNWDGNGYSSSSDYTGPGSAANITASSTASFFGHAWTAHDIQVFVPGSYSFNVTLGGGNPETGTLSATVPAGMLGMHMLFDWGGSNNIDVFVVAKLSAVFGAGLLYSTTTSTNGRFKCDSSFTGTITKNCLYDGPMTANFNTAPAPTKNQVWMMASIDGNGDGIMGIPMAAGGPFAGFNANFNASLTPTPKSSAVPLPGAVWLFGSGLMGLLGFSRRHKQ